MVEAREEVGTKCETARSAIIWWNRKRNKAVHAGRQSRARESEKGTVQGHVTVTELSLSQEKLARAHGRHAHVWISLCNSTVTCTKNELQSTDLTFWKNSLSLLVSLRGLNAILIQHSIKYVRPVQ
jgi:hypothetical protein